MSKDKETGVIIVERAAKLMIVTVPQRDGPDRTYRFTAEHSPITFEGHQYVPLSVFDQQRYAELAKEKA